MNSKKRNYRRYLRSPRWKEVRANAIKWANGECQFCGSCENLHVHHKRYERFGNELPDDLLVLCKPCHMRYHYDATVQPFVRLAPVRQVPIEEYLARKAAESHALG